MSIKVDSLVQRRIAQGTEIVKNAHKTTQPKANYLTVKDLNIHCWVS